jgi:hypothetical protein
VDNFVIYPIDILYARVDTTVMKNTDTDQTAEAELAAFMERYEARHQIGGSAKAWKTAKDKAQAKAAQAKATK